MSEITTNSHPSRKRNALTAGAVAAALAGGYALGGTNVTAQNVDPNASTKTPVVQTPATNDAAVMQRAFNDVSKAIEPAVVTITTEGERRQGAGRNRMRPFPGNPGGPGGADPFGGGGGDPFEEFLRRFPGFGGQGGQDQNWQPNAAQKEQMRQYFRDIQERGGRGGGLGSGMIYRQDGYIITNAHVVRGADKVIVKLNDGRIFRNAKVVGSDERTDIAVVKIDGTKLPTVQTGDSGKVNVGDWAIAIGNPFGFTHTVTVGVISAKARDVPFETATAGDYLQTDASINPGNSGGPLCDIYGRVIGVNNAIYSSSGGNVGIGFAIPINTAKSIADRLVQSGKIVRGYLGVEIRSIDTAEDAQIAAGLGLDPSVRGVLVRSVTDANGPGAKAGLQAGDVVTEFNGKKVTRSIDLQRMVGDAPVGSNVTLRVLRGDQSLNLNARLGELKPATDADAPNAQPNPGAEEGAAAPSVYGMRLSPVSPNLSQRFNLKDARGVVVVTVDPNSPAAEAGVRPGDVIERVGQTPVTSRTDVLNAAKRILDRQNADTEKTVGLFINRAGQRGFYFVQPGS